MFSGEYFEIFKNTFSHRTPPLTMLEPLPRYSGKIWKTLREEILRILLSFHLSTVRSSHRRCSVKKGVLGNFAKFTGEHLCQSLFFNKVAGLRQPNGFAILILNFRGTWLKVAPTLSIFVTKI